MKVYRAFATILAIVFGISIGIFFISSCAAQTAIKEPVTEEYYEMLKENAMNVAKSLDVNVVDDKEITADFYLNKDELVVTVQSFKAKITAMLPISNSSLNVENGNINFQGKADFESVRYIEKNELHPAWWYIVMTIAGSAFVAMMVYSIISSLIPTKKNSKI